MLLLGVIIFDLVRFGFYQKNITKPVFFQKKPQTKTGSNRPVLVRLGYFRTKTSFFSLAWVFLSVWIRFDFFSFRLIKLKPNRTG